MLHLSRQIKRVHTSVNAARMSACATWLAQYATWLAQYLNVIQSGGFAPVRFPFDADFVSRAQGDAGDEPARGGCGIESIGAQPLGGGPFVDGLAVDQQAE